MASNFVVIALLMNYMKNYNILFKIMIIGNRIYKIPLLMGIR